MGKLFGTDGARGIANEKLTCELAMNIGRAAAMVLIDDDCANKPTVLIGKDTRLSSDMLEGALSAGLCSVGANVVILGVVPTPAVAFLVKKYNASAGVMISASHNTFEYNGIKIFSADGYKLPDALEEKIESIVLGKDAQYPAPTGAQLGRVTFARNAVDDYVRHVAQSTDTDLSGLKIAVDCSNGSASATAAKLFNKLGADCQILSSSPNGININDKCGSTHMEALTEYVKTHDVDCGIAVDGDADRCMAVDENGNIVDGDHIIAICAKDMNDKGTLKGSAAVGTVMTNMGFGLFCEANGIKFVSTDVGDRYVLENMLENGYNLGGEQSGHVIFKDYATTGDGQLTAVQLLSIVKRSGKKLSELASVMTQYPQELVNVIVPNENKSRFHTDKAIKNEVERVKNVLGDRGRILVRVSGTEPLVRVMLEGKDKSEIQVLAQGVAQIVEERLK